MGKKSRLKRRRRQLRDQGLPTNTCVAHEIVEIRHDPPGPKMSESLSKLIEPYLNEVETPEDMERFVAYAAIAWNLAMIGEDPYEAVAEEMTKLNHPHPEVVGAFVCELVNRKRRLFPNDHRTVAGWEVTLRPDGRFHIQTASSREG